MSLKEFDADLQKIFEGKLTPPLVKWNDWFIYPLTIWKLKEMKPWIFAYGYTLIMHPYYWSWNYNNIKCCGDNGMTLVKFVAVRWNWFHDWAVYTSMTADFEKANNFDWIEHLKVDYDAIKRTWQKLYLWYWSDFWEKNSWKAILELMFWWDKEVMNLYRDR